jgi:hypothetical protein
MNSPWVPTEEGSEVRVVQGDDGLWFGQERWPDKPDEVEVVCGQRFELRGSAVFDIADHFGAITDEALKSLHEATPRRERA